MDCYLDFMLQIILSLILGNSYQVADYGLIFREKLSGDTATFYVMQMFIYLSMPKERECRPTIIN